MHEIIPRVIALDPTTRGFAYAVMESSETLVAFGSVEVREWSKDRILKRAQGILDRYLIELVVLEDSSFTRRGKRATRLIDALAEGAQALGIPTFSVRRADLREEFQSSGTTKYEIAVALARLFPELEPRLPSPRKPYMAEDARMNVFDAVSFAFTVLREIERQRASR